MNVSMASEWGWEEFIGDHLEIHREKQHCLN